MFVCYLSTPFAMYIYSHMRHASSFQVVISCVPQLLGVLLMPSSSNSTGMLCFGFQRLAVLHVCREDTYTLRLQLNCCTKVQQMTMNLQAAQDDVNRNACHVPTTMTEHLQVYLLTYTALNDVIYEEYHFIVLHTTIAQTQTQLWYFSSMGVESLPQHRS
jgi:hypothetical protein